MAVPTLAELRAAQSKSATPTLAELRAARAAAPDAPIEPNWWQKIRPYVGTAAETTGALAGGVLGAPVAPPFGSIAGASAGYAAARQGMNALDTMFGNRGPVSFGDEVGGAVSDLATGASMEMGGQVLGPVLGSIASKVKTSGAERKAARILKDALGPDLAAARMILGNADSGVTAGQALVDLESPTFQALVQRALQRDPRWLNNLMKGQSDEVVNALTKIAGGTDETAMRAAAEASHTNVNNALIPQLEQELGAANIAGQKLPKLEAEAARLREAASSKVTDVGRFTAAGERATEASKTWRPSTSEGNFGDTWSTSHAPTNLPLPLRKHTYPAELAKRAEEVSQQAADSSLLFGEAARFKEAAIASLEAHGLKPLKPDAIVSKIEGILKNPKYAENADLEGAMLNLKEGLLKWTNKNGVIDAWALDSIRKNSINAFIAKQYPGASVTAQKKLAAGLTGRIKPLIVDAIEEAGGTGYGDYLRSYSAAMNQIAEQKLTGKALTLYQKNPAKFVELVEGGNPKLVEKTFGPGQYDIAKEVSENTLATMQDAARKALRDIKIDKQASSGQEALRQLLMQDMSMVRLPSYLNVIASSTNKALDMIEKRIGRKTMGILTEALKSGKSANQLLEALPPDQKARIGNLLENPSLWTQGGKAAATTAVVGSNALSNVPQERRNALAQ